jgi:glycosyltransferase involved in cell wall biosynthesis
MTDYKFRVLHTESSPGWGGQENRIIEEATGLKERGADVIIASQPGSVILERAREKGIETREVPMRKSYDIPAILRLIRIIRDDRIDIINTHSGKDSLLAALAGRLSGKRPAIVRTRHLALPITSLVTYRHLPDRVVTVSRHVKKYLVSAGVPERMVTAVPTGVNTEVFNPEIYDNTLREELGIREDVPLIGTVGILRKKKGHHHLLEAIPAVLRRFPEALFVFAGDGPQWKNLHNAIKRLCLEKVVILLGRRRDVPRILQALDLFVLPTLQEALGTAFLEAMAMEVPVIGTSVDGVTEVIEHGKTGMLVPPGDPGGLSNVIIELLEQPERAKTLAREGRKKVAACFTKERMCDGMINVYLSVLKEVGKA